MFSADYEVAAADKRRVFRSSVSFDANIGKCRRTLCRVVDISLRGARLETYGALTRGATIWLNLPAIGQVLVDVRWADDLSAGCEFRKPLSKEQLLSLLTGNA